MTTGLTLGKYAPLHRGHQLVIERACAENEHVIVVIYDAPDVTRIPLETRAGWIRALYPNVEVLLARHGPTVVGDSLEVTRLHDVYLQRLLAGRQITHFYSSEFYGEHVSRAFNAIDRRIDESRSLIPISGTAVRRDPFRYRDFLAPVVYRDLITKVVFLGAPSTGKTTLASYLAEQFKTKWVPEFGREYWDQHQVERRLTLDQLAEIAIGHRHREDQIALDSNRYLFIDTDATTTFQFSLYYHSKVHPTVVKLAAECRDRYQVFVVCDTDIPYDDTWDRSGEVYRKNFQAAIESDLIRRGIKYVKVAGPIEQRAEQIVDILKRFEA